MNKSIKKLKLFLAFSIFAVFFFGCDDDFWDFPPKYKDESLTLTFKVKTNDEEGNAVVTIKQRKEKDTDKDADGFIYTTDGTEPSVEYDEDASGHLSYSGEKYTGDVTVKKDCTVMAIAYRIDKSLDTAKYSNTFDQSVNVDEFVDYKFSYVDVGNALKKSGEFNFSTDTFTYKSSEVESLPNSKFVMTIYADVDPTIGEWYIDLYTNGNPDADFDSTDHFARGVYISPTCFKASSSNKPSDGNLKFYTLDQEILKTVTAKYDSNGNYSFTLPMNNKFFEKVTSAD